MDKLLPFVLSLIVLVIAANFLVKFTTGLSASLKLSPLVIAATAVALGTSLPELSVSFSSIMQGVPNFSFGNFIGSNITNIGLILGFSILLFPIRVGTEKTQRNNFIFFLITLIFIAIQFCPDEIRKLATWGLLSFYFIFFFLEIFWGEEGSHHEDKKAIHKMKKSKLSPAGNLLGMGVCLTTLGLSSKFFVSSAVEISSFLHIKTEIFGLSVAALGTTLPELMTSLSAGARKEWKLLFGNIQGSNIFNLAVIGTIISLFGHTKQFVGENFSFVYLFIMSTAIFILTRRYSGKKIPRLFGLGFLLGYVSYLFLLTKL
jgi:cation:H+ antiporter